MDAPNDPTVTGFEIQYSPAGGIGQVLIADTGNLLDLDYSTLQSFGPSDESRSEEEQFIFNAFRRLTGYLYGHHNSREFRIRAINAWGKGGSSNWVAPFQ